ncbi:camp-regulated phosphoprotein family protein Igo1 [Ilyonectria destructans]|nr:camp-regulated phosphoprotein family protein Igo1 [Ilyonectria destructans]KAH6988727.1 camp-regulated phosphoprotein family protein Igo1 [Ilyonectria destructans]
MNLPKETEVPTEKNRRIRQLYGISPKTAKSPSLLSRQLDDRKFFDSGDFALSQAHESSDIGNINTGIEHPIRKNISHPSAPVPSSSNVEENANQEMGGERRSVELKSDSHLKQDTTSQTRGEPGGTQPRSNA